MMKNLGPLTWAWLIIIGGIMLIPGGIIPIVQTRTGFIIIALISIALGVAGFMTNNRNRPGG